jgi:hypothetical protein
MSCHYDIPLSSSLDSAAAAAVARALHLAAHRLSLKESTMTVLTRIGPVAVFVILAAHLAAAQPLAAVITGRVVDARTAQPLARVLIRVEHQPVFAESAADGTFRLAVAPGAAVIVVSMIGYAELRREVTVVADQSHELLIELSEGAGHYEERVTVTGSVSHDADRAPAGAVLHGRDLQALRGVMMDDPLRAVQSLPAATSTDDFYSEFAVRGSTFRHVGLAIDGIPSPYLIHGIHGVTDGGSIAMVNSEALGSASLLPGSYPQRTGRRLGAHIELTTRDGSRDGFHGRAGLSGTSANVIAEGPLPNGRGAWLASARRSYLDYLLARIDPDGSFGFGFSDGLAKLTLDVGARHQLQVLNVFGRSVFDEHPDDLGVNDEALAKSRAWLSALTWRFLPSARVALFQRVYATGMDFRNVNGGNVLLDGGRDRVIGWRSDATIAMGRHWVAEFGGDLQQVSHALERHRTFDGASQPTALTDHHASSNAASAYAQATARFGAATLTPGARVDYWQATDMTAASPWVTGELRLSPATRLRGGAGLYRQTPELSYLTGPGGNRDLADERAVHADLTVAQSLPGAIEAQLTVFNRDENDVLRAPGAEPRRLPDGSITLGRGDARWENRLTGRARGVEAVIRRDSPDGFSGWIAYAVSRHRYDDAAAAEQFWSDRDQRHTFSAYIHSRLSNRTSLAAKLRYGSNYPITGYVGEQPPSDNAPPLFGGMRPLFLSLVEERNTLRLPAYLRLDVRADRAVTIGGRRVTFFAEVANALNRRNERNVPYDIQRNGRVSGVTDSLLPIVPSAGFVVEF